MMRNQRHANPELVLLGKIFGQRDARQEWQGNRTFADIKMAREASLITREKALGLTPRTTGSLNGLLYGCQIIA